MLKLFTASATVKEKLDQVPTRNLNEERSVGYITHKVTIWSPDQLEPASKNDPEQVIHLFGKTIHKAEKFFSLKRYFQSFSWLFFF